MRFKRLLCGIAVVLAVVVFCTSCGSKSPSLVTIAPTATVTPVPTATVVPIPTTSAVLRDPTRDELSSFLNTFLQTHSAGDWMERRTAYNTDLISEAEAQGIRCGLAFYSYSDGFISNPDAAVRINNVLYGITYDAVAPMNAFLDQYNQIAFEEHKHLITKVTITWPDKPDEEIKR